jgi:lipoate-protein ligase A
MNNTLFIDNRGNNDPRINLALEEYSLRNLDISRDYILFYINRPSVIIGRHQNTMEEINYEYIRKNGVIVVRRISGGGAVYHDPGNLNFSFITSYDRSKFNNYEKFNRPIIEALKSLGVQAELTGRNDIVVGERKISGNAQFTSKDRMFSHGTLLFDSDLEKVVQALKVKAGKIESKGIKSVRSRVANISGFLNHGMDINQFKDYLLKYLFAGSEETPVYHFSEPEWEKINQFAREKYFQWDWNFGESPQFNVKNTHRFPFGEIDVRILVERGHISNIKFYGDFFGKAEIEKLQNLFINLPYDRDPIEESLQGVDLTVYFGDIRREEFLDLLF